MRSTEEILPSHRLMHSNRMEAIKDVVKRSKPNAAYFYCRSMKKKCSSFPGNGRCDNCRQQGDKMVCMFDDRWPSYVSKYNGHPFYTYIMTPSVHYEILVREMNYGDDLWR